MTLLIGCIALAVSTSTRSTQHSEPVVLNEIATVCGSGWIFTVADGTKMEGTIEALREAIGIIYGGEFGRFEGIDFEEVATKRRSDVEIDSLLKNKKFQQALGGDVISALNRVHVARAVFYALAPRADASGDFLDSTPAKRYFAAQEEAEALLRHRFGILKSENDTDCG